MAMPKHVCAATLTGAVEYVRRRFGDEGVAQVLGGLVDNPAYTVEAKLDPGREEPFREELLRDRSYWVSTEFASALLDRVGDLVGGAHPMREVGSAVFHETLSKLTLFLVRFGGPGLMATQAARLNRRHNRNKDVRLIDLGPTHAVFHLCYREGCTPSKSICDYNVGVYAAAITASGGRNVLADETTCCLEGAPHCTVELSWARARKPSRIVTSLSRWLIRRFTHQLVDDYERAIVDRERLIEELKASEQRYRALTDSSLTGVYICDQGNISFANPRLATVFGVPSAQTLAGKSFSSFVHPDDRKAVLAILDVSSDGSREEPYHSEFRIVRPDGVEVWVENLAVPITLDHRAVIMGNVVDITNRKLWAESSSRIEKLESVGLLAGRIAHDLNNFLTSMTTGVTLAQDTVEKDGEVAELLEDLLVSCNEARGLTRQLLTFAKGGAPNKKLTHVADLLTAAGSFALRGSQCKLELEIPEDLWWANIDPGQFSQVVHNAVLNADQAMPDGGIVTLAAENVTVKPGDPQPLSPGPYVKIDVLDRGVGIAASNLSKVFDPFFTTKDKGSGLGLSSILSIVQSHGGYASVDSTVGHGTALTAFFPASVRRAQTDRKSVGVVPAVGSGRLLIMDDEKNIRKNAKRLGERLGYETVVCADGAEAIELYKDGMDKNRPFRAVILDLTVPAGLGGKRAVAKLLDLDPNVRVIVSSGYNADTHLGNYRELGFVGVLQKPYTLEEFGRVLTEVLTN